MDKKNKGFPIKWTFEEDWGKWRTFECELIEDEEIWTNTRPYKCKSGNETYILHLKKEDLWAVD